MDDLALLVGRVILAWGALDQQLHYSLNTLSLALGEPWERGEGRFSERKKLFRRKLVKLNSGDDAIRNLDRFLCGYLDVVESERGIIAHGMVSARENGARFLHMPEFLGTTIVGDSIPAAYFTHQQLERLVWEIQDAMGLIMALTFDAISPPDQRENRKAPLLSRSRQSGAGPIWPRPSTPSDTVKATH